MRETMQLKAPCPKTLVDGFDAEIVLEPTCLFAGEIFETLFIDHYFRLSTTNNGTNPQYPLHCSLTLHITQFFEPCTITFPLPSNSLFGIVILEHYQSLSAVRVMQMIQGGVPSAVLILWITDDRNKSTRTTVYKIATAANTIH